VNDYGRPVIAASHTDACALHFNRSHTHSLMRSRWPAKLPSARMSKT